MRRELVWVVLAIGAVVPGCDCGGSQSGSSITAFDGHPLRCRVAKARIPVPGGPADKPGKGAGGGGRESTRLESLTPRSPLFPSTTLFRSRTMTGYAS